MTGYFDEATREVTTYSSAFRDEPEKFLQAVAEVEARVIKDVTLCTGDREFPHDLREAMLTKIAVLRVDPGPGMPETEGRRAALACRYSELIEDLHSLFHELARRRLVFRFGLVQDSPRGFLKLRDEWINDTGGRLQFGERYVLDGVVKYDREDSGCALISENIGFDEEGTHNMFVRIQSWDENKQHRHALSLAGKRVRVTIEVVE